MVVVSKSLSASRVSPEEYLERERNAEFKSEYFNGQVVAMAGASPTHNTIKENLSGEFYIQLKGKSCRSFSSDQRVSLPATNDYVYPDLVVVCGTPHYVDTGLDTLINPTLIVEVLSDTTEQTDRIVKLDAYRTIPTLSDYIMVSQREPRIEHYSRRSDNQWLLTIYTTLDQTAVLENVGCSLRLADIYDRVEFAPPNAEQHTEIQSSSS